MNEAIRQEVLTTTCELVNQYFETYSCNKPVQEQFNAKLFPLVVKWYKQFTEINGTNLDNDFFDNLLLEEELGYGKEWENAKNHYTAFDNLKELFVGRERYFAGKGFIYTLNFFRHYDSLLNLNIDYQKMDVLYNAKKKEFFIALVSMSNENWKKLFVQLKQEKVDMPLQELKWKSNQFKHDFHTVWKHKNGTLEKVATYSPMNNVFKVENTQLDTMQVIDVNDPFVFSSFYTPLLHLVEYVKSSDFLNDVSQARDDIKLSVMLYLNNRFNFNLSNIHNINDKMLKEIVDYLEECEAKWNKERLLTNSKQNIKYHVIDCFFSIHDLNKEFQREIVFAIDGETNPTKFKRNNEVKINGEIKRNGKEKNTLYVITGGSYDSWNEWNCFTINALTPTGKISKKGQEVCIFDFFESVVECNGDEREDRIFEIAE